MKKLWSIPCLLILLIHVVVSFGQPGGAKPVITGQPDSTPADPVSGYPDGFALELIQGKIIKSAEQQLHQTRIA